MSYDFSHSVDRTGSRAEKWDRGNIAGICGNADALPFWVADMDLPVSDGIRQALEDEARLGVIGYRNSSALKPAFISFMKERHDTVLDEDHVAFAQGMLHAIALAMGRVIVPYHMKRTAEGFTLDPDEWKAAGEGCQAILFCSPHNPTGIVFTDSELESILTLARDRGQLVLCDEIHSDLALPGFRHIPMVKANERIGADVITFAAASKSFNIAGEHCAFACFSSKEMRLQRRLHGRDGLSAWDGVQQAAVQTSGEKPEPAGGFPQDTMSRAKAVQGSCLVHRVHRLQRDLGQGGPGQAEKPAAV